MLPHMAGHLVVSEAWPSFERIGIHLEGQGDLVSRLIMGIIRVTIWVIGVIKLLTKSP